jgi:hypothetical protein
VDHPDHREPFGLRHFPVERGEVLDPRSPQPPVAGSRDQSSSNWLTTVLGLNFQTSWVVEDCDPPAGRSTSSSRMNLSWSAAFASERLSVVRGEDRQVSTSRDEPAVAALLEQGDRQLHEFLIEPREVPHEARA